MSKLSDIRQHFKQWCSVHKRARIALRVGAVLLALLLILALLLWFFTACKWGLFKPKNPFSLQEGPKAADELRMIYDGVEYSYNPDVVNILLMGIDHVDENTEGWDDSIARGGQADTLILCTFNTKTGSAQLLPIPRDTQAQMGVPSLDGQSIGLPVDGPLCLAHSYGSNRMESGQLTQAAVSQLLYGVPIHRFASVNMEAISHVTDFVGGVPVWVVDDYQEVAGLPTGTGLLLDGEGAELYVRSRGLAIMDGQNLSRMVRQRIYLFALLDVVKQKSKENLLFPLSLYREMTPYMTTDLSLREIGNLAAAVLDGGEIEVHVMDGETRDKLYYPNVSFLKSYLRTYCFMPV